MLSGMVEPTGDPTTLKKEERAMRPTPEVVRKWSSKPNVGKFGLIWADLGSFGLICGDLW